MDHQWATMAGGHPEQAEKLRDRGLFADGESATGSAERIPPPPYEAERTDARQLASKAGAIARAAANEIGHSPTLLAQYATIAQSLALASLAMQKAYQQ